MLSSEGTKNPPQIDEIKLKQAPKEDSNEPQCCDFCGQELSFLDVKRSERRKYCSKSCQSRASQGRVRARMAMTPSKRYAARLKYSSPLYFN
jgi:hypothetical protein